MCQDGCVHMGEYESTFVESNHLTRSQEVIKFMRFLFFDASAGVVQIGVYTFLYTVVGITVWAGSYLPALIASVLWSFTANRKFTFKSVSNVPVAMMKVTMYYLIFTPVSLWWGTELTKGSWGISKGAQSFIVLIGTMVINFVTEFMVYRFWVYRRSINTSASGVREQEKYELPVTETVVS